MSKKEINKEMKESLLVKFNKFLWQDINLEATVSGSHRISKDNLYLLRCFFLYYSISVYIVGIMEYRFAFVENLMYLTQWGLFLNISFFYLSTRIMKDKKFEEKYSKVAHVIFEIGFSIQFVITFLFWAAIYETLTRTKDLAFFYQTISEHGGMYFILIVDKFFNNIKFYKRHFVYLVAFVLVYLTYNVAITLSYQPVYTIICWRKPLSFIMAGGAIIGALLNFAFGKLYYDLFKMSKIEQTTQNKAIKSKPQKQQQSNQLQK